ncbi:calcium-binding protein [Couchioplanes azureus]|uniref:calcium-binding protein n=1 Tax=Couchioplanes caeruleus TaxID=56438 RepID=UPI0016709965|nr:hypothetical protein [Couchioplanes caeruleus]
MKLDGFSGDGALDEFDNVQRDVEHVTGTPYADVLTGNDEANWLDGSRGNDKIDGREGDDKLVGDAGNDTIDGAGGDDWISDGTGADIASGGYADDTFSLDGDADAGDTLVGGYGTDLVDFQYRREAVRVSLDGVANDGVAGENDNLSEVETIHGTDYDDVLVGGKALVSLFGRGGDDAIDVADGNPGDVADGGDGTDKCRADEPDFVRDCES